MGIVVCLANAALFGQLPSRSEQPRSKEEPKDQRIIHTYPDFHKLDPQERLKRLDQWSREFPETELVKLRAQQYMSAYHAARQPAKAIEWAHKLLEIAPGDFGATYVIALLTPATGSKDAETLAAGEQAAKALLEGMIDKQFGSKPAQVPQTAWDAEKKKTEVFANKNLGWIEMTRENHLAAEAYFKRVLELQPGNAQVSEWLATVAFAQRDPEKNILVFWSLARAAAFEGESALPADERERIGAELKELYTRYTGTEKGLAELLLKAKASAFPPPGFDLGFDTYRD
jgi:tetratricopeptide (TPR) repeat protein